MDFQNTLGIITGIITVLGVVVGLTRYITQLQHKLTQEKLEKEVERLNSLYQVSQAQYEDARKELIKAKGIGAESLARKLHLDDALTQIMKVSEAEAGSIYIPSNKAGYLIFLSIQPLNQQTSKLKLTRIPVSKSLAGRCYATGESFIVSNAKQNPEHFKKADNITGVTTEDTLQLPLRHQGQTIGVLQLMNKEGRAKFEETDLKHIELATEDIAKYVADFIKAIPNVDETLGIRPEDEDENATVMFCDLTNSSLLFQELNPSMAIRCINEYLEKITNIAFEHGATVDKYIGDGVIFRFNVPRPIDNHLMKAVQSAFKIQEEFEELRDQWPIVLGERGGMYTRAGISFGRVQQALVGHPQYQYLTILGRPVNIAVNLCEAADRSRSVIVVDEAAYKQLPNSFKAKPLQKDQIGKAASFISSAYELSRT
ncbi:MAG TPA: adenylate/guanylate cyclase domain-containing protein [Anaerolineales bacterium]|nr:adenylate/guanylate cyclase domain-containing protein [Anaerolineales bacterium]